MTDFDLTKTDTTDLVLKADEAEVVGATKQTIEILPIMDNQRAKELQDKAKAYVTEISTIQPKSPEFSEKIKSISSIGKNEILRSSEQGSRLLDRANTSFIASKRVGKESAQAKVAGELVDLRNLVEDLNPYGKKLKGLNKILDTLPGGRKLIKYFRKNESSQQQIQAIVGHLVNGQDELNKDNISLQQERDNLWKLMGELNEYNVLADALDNAAVEKITELKAEGRHQEAAVIDSDVLFPIRKRKNDIVTQLNVSAHGYLAMEVVQRTNTELIDGVERTRTSTINALKVASIVSSALSTQKSMIKTIDSLNDVTNRMIVQTSEDMRDQSSDIQRQAASSSINPESLKIAFDNLFSTMDSLDNFKSQANKELSKTITVLKEQVGRAAPYVQRAKELEG